jgi:hypothetical protein
MAYEKPFLPPMTIEDMRTAADHFGFKFRAANTVSASAAVVADARQAAAELGVRVPQGGVTLARLDEMLLWPKVVPPAQRVRLKNQLAAAGQLIGPGGGDVHERTYLTACLMLKKAGLQPRAHTVHELDAHFSKGTLSVAHRMEIKSALHAAGLLRDDIVAAPARKPDAAAVRGICAQLDVDPPPPGHKLSLAAVNRAIREKGFDVSRSTDTKARLHAAGVLD